MKKGKIKNKVLVTLITSAVLSVLSFSTIIGLNILSENKDLDSETQSHITNGIGASAFVGTFSSFTTLLTSAITIENNMEKNKKSDTEKSEDNLDKISKGM